MQIVDHEVIDNIQEWINLPKFQRLDHDKDPIVGDRDGTYNMTIQKCHSRKHYAAYHGSPQSEE